jgi:hypothetical protein
MARVRPVAGRATKREPKEEFYYRVHCVVVLSVHQMRTKIINRTAPGIAKHDYFPERSRFSMRMVFMSSFRSSILLNH